MPVTLPNLLTLSRIAAVPFLVAAFFLPPPLGPWLAFALFAAASATDFLDGWLARRLNLVSAWGRFLDPVADKLLVTAVLVPLVADGRAPAIAALVILCRELLVSALREEMARHGEVVAVSRLAKWKTAAQMVAIGLLLIGESAADVGVPAAVTLDGGAALLWLAAVLSVAAGAGYTGQMGRGLRRLAAADANRPRR